MRTQEMQALIDSFQRETFGIDMTEAMQKRTCVICKKPVTKFSSDIVAREYVLSGMCEECQGTVFTAPCED